MAAEVWMSVRRAGLPFHIIDGRKTTCGRYVSDVAGGDVIRGVALTAEEAQAAGASPCKLCHEPRSPHQQPLVIPSALTAVSRI